jgi:DNA-binding beta-propeller fold protein YncE
VTRGTLRRALAVLALAVLAVTTMPAASHPRLAALTFTGKAGVVLLSDGQLVAFDPITGAIGRRLYQVPFTHRALEAVAWNDAGQWMVCLPVFLQSGDSGRSWLLQQGGDRQFWTWLPTRGLYVGVGIDAARGVGYVANAGTREIFALPLSRRGAQTRYVGSVAQAGQLGATAFDPERRELFVSDADTAAVYALSVDSGTVRDAGAVRGGEIRAVAIDAARRRLLIADASQEAVWSLPLDGGAVARYSALPQFKDPTGVSVAPDGRVWVADAGAATVFRLSPDGSRADASTRW